MVKQDAELEKFAANHKALLKRLIDGPEIPGAFIAASMDICTNRVKATNKLGTALAVVVPVLPEGAGPIPEDSHKEYEEVSLVPVAKDKTVVADTLYPEREPVRDPLQ
ncbi:hypothetical protein SI65_09195 [Aspergillus cristatus]|uniref:Uncharacterized protein n=1 Tax=Aspergillus cristatus TaxID=573508 RepID=A0A1E3B2V4_ASPCR|nr:hypothetical protein SI65_09195 [Aspergillus cristatus]